MHAYASDARDREVVPYYVAALAILAAFVVNWVLSALRLNPPWWFGAPSALSLYGAFRLLYDRYIWRWQSIPFVRSVIPDLSGTWVGVIRSTHHQSQTVISAVLHIEQTWSQIRIRLETESSSSSSASAALNVSTSARDGLTYDYLNEPSAFAGDALHIHRGSAHLRLSVERERLDGEYYTGRDRSTYGEMAFKRIERTLVPRQEALKRGMSLLDELHARIAAVSVAPQSQPGATQ